MKMAATMFLSLVNCALWCICLADRLAVEMTMVENASALGAFCLDGSWPAYHLHKGSGDGERNWILQFEGGGWCYDLKSCLERAPTRRGSTTHKNKMAYFNGILSNDASLNPDFYNWNRVKLRYCDGGSFAGDSMSENGTSVIYFRGQKIWEAIIQDLLPKGLAQAEKAMLSGCSAGGLSAFLQCDNFAAALPKTATVKCMSDGGFIMDAKDITLNHKIRSSFESLVTLQGIEKNLNKDCTNSFKENPKLCIFPQYALRFIKTPFFVLNAAYDEFQWNHILVPYSADKQGQWKSCKLDRAQCDAKQIETLQGFRNEMLTALDFFLKNSDGGMFINSCFTHCQSEFQETWFAADSPRLHDKTIAEAVGDWFFDRNITKEIDCPYPCDNNCHNLTPASPGSES